MELGWSVKAATSSGMLPRGCQPIRADHCRPMGKEGIQTMAQDLEPLLELFRLLSDKTRLNLLMMLAHGERNVSSLCDELKLPQPTVSHHLGLLRSRNMISSRRRGKNVFYELNGQLDVKPGTTLEISWEPFTVRITDASA